MLLSDKQEVIEFKAYRCKLILPSVEDKTYSQAIEF